MDEGKAKARVLGGYPQITGQGNRSAAPHSHAVDAGNHRLCHATQQLSQAIGAAADALTPLCFALACTPCKRVFQITTGTKRIALPGQHQRMHLRVLRRPFAGLQDLARRLLTERIAPLGPVHDDPGHSAMQLTKEIGKFHRSHRKFKLYVRTILNKRTLVNDRNKSGTR